MPYLIQYHSRAGSSFFESRRSDMVERREQPAEFPDRDSAVNHAKLVLMSSSRDLESFPIFESTGSRYVLETAAIQVKEVKP